MSTQEIINNLKLLRQPELKKFKQFIISSNDFPSGKTKLFRNFIDYAPDKDNGDIYKTHVYRTLLVIHEQITSYDADKSNFIRILNGITPDSQKIGSVLRQDQLQQKEMRR